MNTSDSLKENLNGKTALFDTCVLSTIRTNIKNPDVQGFLKMLDEIECKPVVTDLIRLEFLRDANKNEELIARKQFLEELCQEFSLPVYKEMYTDAMILSYIHTHNQNRGIELVDLTTSAFLKKYPHKEGLVLVTVNHADFPLSIHDRVGSMVLDVGKTLATLGFYRVNMEKWNFEIKELMKDQNWLKK